MKSIILDTNAYSLLVRLPESTIKSEVLSADLVYFSVIVVGELLFGFKYGTKLKDNTNQLDSFLNEKHVSLTEINSDTAKYYSEISLHLRKIGAPIPTNDIWIAAQALETGSTLVTLDQHFNQIEGLKIFSPQETT